MRRLSGWRSQGKARPCCQMPQQFHNAALRSIVRPILWGKLGSISLPESDVGVDLSVPSTESRSSEPRTLPQPAASAPAAQAAPAPAAPSAAVDPLSAMAHAAKSVVPSAAIDPLAAVSTFRQLHSALLLPRPATTPGFVEQPCPPKGPFTPFFCRWPQEVPRKQLLLQQ